MTKEKNQKLETVLAMARAQLASMNAVINSSPKQTPTHHFNSYKQYAVQYNRLVNLVLKFQPNLGSFLHEYNEDKIPSLGKTLVTQQHSIFQSVHSSLSQLCALLESELGGRHTANEVLSLKDFLQISLRPAMLGNKPETEREVQDTIEKILIGRRMQKGLDYDRETGRIKFSTKESVPDFVFQPLSTALEVKLAKNSAKLARLVDEINADILSYQKSYKHIIILVYDIGSISDVQQFKRDIESISFVQVVVVKH